MKRLFLLLLTIMLSTFVHAYDFIVDGIYYNILSAENRTVEVTYDTDPDNIPVLSYSETYRDDVVIPTEVTYSDVTYQVVKIGNKAFMKCNYLTSVVIPDCVTSIDNQAFAYCYNLNTANLPDNLKNIGIGAFQLCQRLPVSSLPDGLETIGESAFYNCYQITSISIPESVTSIGYAAFDGTPLYNNQSNGMTYVDNWAYYYKGTIPENTEIVIRSGTRGIVDGAIYWEHYDRENVKSVSLPEGLLYIGKNCFDGCENITSIDLPSSVTTIGSYAFAGTGITSIYIPSSVTELADGAFPFGNIVEATLDIEEIGSWFSSSSAINTVTLGSHVKSIGDGAFSNCYYLAFLTLSDDLESIGDKAFYYCSALTSVSIPETIVSIGDEAFEFCDGLTSIYLPEGLVSIGDNAFSYCNGLTSITLPSSLTSVGEYAFANCEDLKEVTLNMENINFNLYISSAEKLVFGPKVKSISRMLSFGSLTSVTFNSNVPEIVEDGLGDYAYSTCYLYVPSEYYGNYRNKFDPFNDKTKSGDFYGGGFTLQSMATTNVTLAPAGFGTYYNSENAVLLPSSLSAKAVNKVAYRQLNYATVAEAGGIVPANTAVILCGPQTGVATNYTLNITTGGTYRGENLLHGSDEATTTTGGEVYYKLTYGSAAGHEDVFGWYWGAEDGEAFSIGAHKAWLAVSREEAGLDSGSPVKSFGLLDGDYTDGIQVISEHRLPEEKAEIIYDLSGRRIIRPTSGLYIVNGKKVVIK